MYKNMCAILFYSTSFCSDLHLSILFYSTLFYSVREYTGKFENNREEYIMGNWDNFGSADYGLVFLGTFR